MFRVVPWSPVPELPDLERVAIVDVQLVGDELANDVPFTSEMVGGRSTTTASAYTYSSLSDRLPPHEMETIRAFVLGLLSELAHRQSVLLFSSGRLFPSESGLAEEDEYVAFAAHSEDQRMNGQIEVAEVQCADLKYYLGLFGKYDAVKGLLIQPGKMRSVLGALLLSDPVPATERSFVTHAPNLRAVGAVLKHGSYLFEEVRNGTSLRIVSGSLSVQKLKNIVERHVERYLRST